MVVGGRDGGKMGVQAKVKVEVKVEAEGEEEEVRARAEGEMGRKDSVRSGGTGWRKRTEEKGGSRARRVTRQSRQAISAAVKQEVMAEEEEQPLQRGEAMPEPRSHQGGECDGPSEQDGDDDDVEVLEFTYDHTGKNLLVSNLHADVHFADLHRIFGRCGLVREVQMKEPTEFGHSHYAFVKFCSQHEARAAQRAVDRQLKLRGRTLRVIMCRPGAPYPVPMAPSLSASIMHHYLGVGAVSLEIAFLDHAALRHTALSQLQQLQGKHGRASHGPRTNPAAQPTQPSQPARPPTPTAQSQYHSQRPVHGAVDMGSCQRAVMGQHAASAPQAGEEPPDQLVCVVSGHVATLSDPIFGGCMQSTISQLLPQQLHAPFTATRALEVVGKLAYCNAAKDVFAQLRLVRVPGSGRWVPAMAPPPDLVLHTNIKTYLQAIQHADRSNVVIDPFVEVSDDDDDDAPADADGGEAVGDDEDVAAVQDVNAAKVEDQDVFRVDDVDAPLMV